MWISSVFPVRSISLVLVWVFGGHRSFHMHMFPAALVSLPCFDKVKKKLHIVAYTSRDMTRVSLFCLCVLRLIIWFESLNPWIFFKFQCRIFWIKFVYFHFLFAILTLGKAIYVRPQMDIFVYVINSVKNFGQLYFSALSIQDEFQLA
jgi:hypothetical protein